VCLSIGVIPHLETVREVKDHLAALFACARQVRKNNTTDM
jgi:hypothetical protein